MITEILTDDEERDCEIKIIVRPDKWGVDNEFWGVQIDNTITPLYCCNCKTQLKYFYKLNGGRYGQVGSVKCICEADIHCTDSDNIVEYLDTLTTIGKNPIGSYYLDFKKMYKLDNKSFLTIRDKVGLNIYQQYVNETIDLKIVVEELENKYGLKTDNSKDFTFEEIERLPKIINRWFRILYNIQ